MLEDLDLTLEALLTDPDPARPASLANVDVRFEPPGQNFTPDQASVNLFLYEVKENRELRDPVPIVEPAPDGFLRRRPPLRVDCTYMVTAWSNAATGAAAQAAEEHRLLGYAFAWFSRFAVVPEPLLQGVLRNPPPPQPPVFPPVPIAVGQMDGGRSVGEFWSALGVPPRPAFTLVVTVALDLRLRSPEPAVTTLIARYVPGGDPASREELITIGGVVRGPGGDPVPRAWVRLNPVGATTRTGADGRFVFGRIHAGIGYTLDARAAGLGETSAAIDVPSPSGEYIVRFS